MLSSLSITSFTESTIVLSSATPEVPGVTNIQHLEPGARIINSDEVENISPKKKCVKKMNEVERPKIFSV